MCRESDLGLRHEKSLHVFLLAEYKAWAETNGFRRTRGAIQAARGRDLVDGCARAVAVGMMLSCRPVVILLLGADGTANADQSCWPALRDLQRSTTSWRSEWGHGECSTDSGCCHYMIVTHSGASGPIGRCCMIAVWSLGYGCSLRLLREPCSWLLVVVPAIDGRRGREPATEEGF